MQFPDLPDPSLTFSTPLAPSLPPGAGGGGAGDASELPINSTGNVWTVRILRKNFHKPSEWLSPHGDATAAGAERSEAPKSVKICK